MREPSERDEFEAAMADPAFAEFVEDAKSSLLVHPSPEVASKHLAAIVEAATSLEAAPARLPQKSTRRRKFALRVAAVTGAAFMALGGLAYAGVLPQQMQDALSDAAAKAGFSLPVSDEREAANAAHTGDNGKSVSSDVKDVAHNKDLQGREKGDAVSDVADQNRQNENHPTSTATSNPSNEDPPARNDDHPTGKR